MTVKNDLPGAIEDGQVLYPSRSLDVHGSVTVRLRDAPHIQGRGQGHRLSAAKDFGAFGRDARKWLLAEAQAVKREARRRQEQKEHMERQAAWEANKQLVGEDEDECGYFVGKIIGITCCLYFPVFLLLLLALASQPDDADEVAPFAFLVLFVCFLFSTAVPLFGHTAFWRVSAPGWERWWVGAAWLAGALACAFVTLTNVQHALAGHWWTALIIWPCSCCSFVLSCAFASRDPFRFATEDQHGTAWSRAAGRAKPALRWCFCQRGRHPTASIRPSQQKRTLLVSAGASPSMGSASLGVAFGGTSG